MTSEQLWYLSRATGVVSIVLMTAVFVLGLVVSGRRGARRTSAVVTGLHRSLALGMTIFLATHIVSAIVEGYVPISWLSAILPFTSGYETLWMGVGTLSVDILLAVIATSLLRHRMSARAWKRVHLATYALWPMALVHGFALGTTNQQGLRMITVGCAVVGLLAIAWRLTAVTHDARKRQLVQAQEWS